MKKNALILCTFLIGMFSSCSNEDIQELSVANEQNVVTNRSFTVIDEEEVSSSLPMPWQELRIRLTLHSLTN